MALDLDTSGEVTVYVYTDLPGEDMRLRHSETVNTELTTTGRRKAEVRLPGTIKGRYMQLKVGGAAEVRLFAARVLARVLGSSDPWTWYPVPVELTPELFGTAALPIEPTPESFAEARLPIEPTPDGFAEARLPIDPTPDGFAEARLPIDPTPDGFAEVRLPIEPTPEGWATAPLPMRTTRELRTWVTLPVAIVE
ncbi:MAG: hypothetical protein FJW34_00010 [Acidobacteria bacterium]|nr:hypothetical protein [Acidobacteriota bacterium]